MKRTLLLLLGTALMAVSCETIPLSGIRDVEYVEMPGTVVRISVEGGISVEVDEDCEAAEIWSDKNMLPYIEVFADNGGDSFVIRYKRGTKVPAGCRTEVILPYNSELNQIILSGASEFEMDQNLASDSRIILSASGASHFDLEYASAPDVEIELSGASSFSGFLQVENKLRTVISGASSMSAEGNVGKCVAEVSGASSIVGDDSNYLDVYEFDGNISGASNVRIHSDGTIRGILSGASTLRYRGNAYVDVDVSGGSKVVEER